MSGGGQDNLEAQGGKTVQYLAGHENSKTTMDIYAKVKYNKPEELFGVVTVSYTHLDVYKRQTLDTESFHGNYVVTGIMDSINEKEANTCAIILSKAALRCV